MKGIRSDRNQGRSIPSIAEPGSNKYRKGNVPLANLLFAHVVGFRSAFAEVSSTLPQPSQREPSSRRMESQAFTESRQTLKQMNSYEVFVTQHGFMFVPHRPAETEAWVSERRMCGRVGVPRDGCTQVVSQPKDRTHWPGRIFESTGSAQRLGSWT